MDEQLVAGLSPENGDQWLNVWVEISDKCVPQGHLDAGANTL